MFRYTLVLLLLPACASQAPATDVTRQTAPESDRSYTVALAGVRQAAAATSRHQKLDADDKAFAAKVANAERSLDELHAAVVRKAAKDAKNAAANLPTPITVVDAFKAKADVEAELKRDAGIELREATADRLEQISLDNNERVDAVEAVGAEARTLLITSRTCSRNVTWKIKRKIGRALAKQGFETVECSNGRQSWWDALP
jgi:hypothetical protein